MSSNDIQLSRDEFGQLPYLANWSRHEPAALKRTDKGKTDHWSKTKHKTVTLFTTGTDGKTNFYPGERLPHEGKPTHAATLISPHHRVDGCLKHIGTRSFTEMLLEELNGKLPGSTLQKSDPSKQLLRTNANIRAKENYEYWYIEPEPMKHTFKRWMGKGGNVLGTRKR